jgi:hypothetical protein
LIATQGRLFFSHRRLALLLLVFVFSFRHHSLSHLRRPLPFRHQHSLSLLRRSLARSLCSEVPAGLPCSPPLATRAHGALSPQKVGATAGRPAVCATVKGASGRRLQRHPKQTPPCPLPLGLGTVLCAIAATATPLQILLLGRAHLVESPRRGGN